MERTDEVIEFVSERIKEALEGGEKFQKYLLNNENETYFEIVANLLEEEGSYTTPYDSSDIMHFDVVFIPTDTGSTVDVTELLDNIDLNVDDLDDIKELDNQLTEEMILDFFSQNINLLNFDVMYNEDPTEWNRRFADIDDLADKIEQNIDETTVIDVAFENPDLYEVQFRDASHDEYGVELFNPSGVAFDIVGADIADAETLANHYFDNFKYSGLNVNDYTNDRDLVEDMIKNDFVTFRFDFYSEASEIEEIQEDY